MMINSEIVDLIKNSKFDEFKNLTENMDNLSLIADVHGGTLLHHACAKDNVNLIQYLLSKKCYKNIMDTRGANSVILCSLI